MKVKKVKGWIVSDIEFDNEDVFETEEEARDSIDIITEQVERFKCGECDELYEDIEEAKECCK